MAASPDSIIPESEFFTDEYEPLRRELNHWRVGALISAATALIAVVALAWLALHSRLVPYVVRVDRQGWALAAPEALTEAETFAGRDRVLRYEIAGFIRDARQVLGDPLAQAQAIARVRARAGLAAGRYITAWYSGDNQAHDPYELAKHERVTVAIDSILRETPGSEAARLAAAQRERVALPAGAGDVSTYQVEWTEQRWSPAGEAEGETRWQAQLTVALRPPAELGGGAEQNPLGFTVEEISWTEQR